MADDENDDDAPLEVSFSQSKNELGAQLNEEKEHEERHQQNARKRVPGWTKEEASRPSKKKKIAEAAPELDESLFDDADFKGDDGVIDPRFFSVEDFKGDGHENDGRNMAGVWMPETDLFHTLKHTEPTKSEKRKELKEMNKTNDFIDDASIGDSENEGSVFQETTIPKEVIALFESAAKNSTTRKELEDKWKMIIRTRLRGQQYKTLRHRLSSLDKVFVDGFQIETDGTYRLNRAAMRRSLRVQWAFGRTVRRVSHRKLRCGGSMKPSFSFVEREQNRKYNLKEKTFQQKSFWGRKAAHVSKMASTDKLQKWLDF